MKEYEIIIFEDGKPSRTLKGDRVICVVDRDCDAGEIESMTAAGGFEDTARLAISIAAAVHKLAELKLSNKEEAEKFVEEVQRAIILFDILEK